MRDKIANLIGYWDWDNKTTNQCAEAILSLINAERCEWTWDTEREWVTSCGVEVLDDDTYGKYPFCPCCGKRIEVKDANS
jgi:predicted RNA-binding Zn-ribbon protein involved in translation (DUF1610 family)